MISAVIALQNDGVDIALDLIEGVSHIEASRRLRAADIVVDQLNFGYALTAADGLALGKIVVTGISNAPEDDILYSAFRKLSYLDEAPVICASTDSIEKELSNLIDARAEWRKLGLASRRFAEKRHSDVHSARLFASIYSTLNISRDSRSAKLRQLFSAA